MVPVLSLAIPWDTSWPTPSNKPTPPRLTVSARRFAFHWSHHCLRRFHASFCEFATLSDFLWYFKPALCSNEYFEIWKPTKISTDSFKENANFNCPGSLRERRRRGEEEKEGGSGVTLVSRLRGWRRVGQNVASISKRDPCLWRKHATEHLRQFGCFHIPGSTQERSHAHSWTSRPRGRERWTRVREVDTRAFYSMDGDCNYNELLHTVHVAHCAHDNQQRNYVPCTILRKFSRFHVPSVRFAAQVAETDQELLGVFQKNDRVAQIQQWYVCQGTALQAWLKIVKLRMSCSTHGGWCWTSGSIHTGMHTFTANFTEDLSSIFLNLSNVACQQVTTTSTTITSTMCATQSERRATVSSLLLREICTC